MQSVLAGWAGAMAVLMVLTGLFTGLDDRGARIAFITFALLAVLAGIGWFFAPLVQP